MNVIRSLTGLILLLVCYGAHSEGDLNLGSAKRPDIHWQIHNGTADQCGFLGGRIDFCDAHLSSLITASYQTARPNFSRTYVLLAIPIRWYSTTSIAYVAIDTTSGEAHPLPFDFLEVDGEPPSAETGLRHIAFSLDSNEVCLTGLLWAYKETLTGKNCWRLTGDVFKGSRTPFTD